MNDEFIHEFHLKDESILPLVSITPISGRDTNDQKMTNNQDSLGIEIIPLGMTVYLDSRCIASVSVSEVQVKGDIQLTLFSFF